MEKRKVINAKNWPLHFPVVGTLVCYLMLDKFSAPGWLCGAFGVLFGLWYIFVFIDVITKENLPPFK